LTRETCAGFPLKKTNTMTATNSNTPPIEKNETPGAEKKETLTTSEAFQSITEIMDTAKKNNGAEKPEISDAGEGKQKFVFPSGREYVEETFDKSTSSGRVLKLKRRTFTLTDGSTAVVRQGQGKDIRNATRIVTDTNDKSLFMVAIMALVTLVDGTGLTYEDLDDMNGKDYSKIQAEVSDLNF
jgi:hypothetical protein